MKIGILLLLLISPYIFSQDDYSKEDFAQNVELKKIAYQHQIKHNDDLAQYFLDHEIADINMIGYQYLLPFYVGFGIDTDFKNKWTKNDMARDIGLLVKSDQLTPLGLSIALSLCKKHLKDNEGDLCDINQIFFKQKASTPNNAYIYLNPIIQAIEDSDEDELKLLLSLMAKTTVFDNYEHTHKDLNGVIDDFFESNPLSDELIEYNKGSVNQLTNLSDSKQQDMLENIELYTIYDEKISFQLAIEIPNFRPFLEYCKNTSKYKKECLNIADIMISNKDIIPVLIGHAIKIAILKNNGNEKAFLLAEKEHQAFRDQYECLMIDAKAATNDDYLYNLETYNDQINIQRKKGLQAFQYKTNELFYQQEINLGNTTVNNPKDCMNTHL